jgi:hypothetical protein
MSVPTCVSASLHAATHQMSRPTKYGSKKGPVIYIGYPIANLFSYVGAHLWFCSASLHATITHQRWAEQPNIGEKGPLSYTYRIPYRQPFSSIGSNLCVGLIRYMLWHTRDGQSSQILEEKVPLSYIGPYLQPIFLCRCPPMCLHHYICCDTPEMGGADPWLAWHGLQKINIPYRPSGRDYNYRLLMNRVQKVTIKKITHQAEPEEPDLIAQWECSPLLSSIWQSGIRW